MLTFIKSKKLVKFMNNSIEFLCFDLKHLSIISILNCKP